MHLILTSGLLAFFLSGVFVAAGLAQTPGSVTATLSVNPDKGVIYGTVVDANAIPLPNAQVRLRNLETRTIEQTSTTNDRGEFTFVAPPDIPYVVEIVDRPGRVLAVGDVLMTRAGESAGGVIIVPALLESAGRTGLFRATAGAVASAVVGTGMTLLESPAPLLSPEK